MAGLIPRFASLQGPAAFSGSLNWLFRNGVGTATPNLQGFNFGIGLPNMFEGGLIDGRIFFGVLPDDFIAPPFDAPPPTAALFAPAQVPNQVMPADITTVAGGTGPLPAFFPSAPATTPVGFGLTPVGDLGAQALFQQQQQALLQQQAMLQQQAFAQQQAFLQQQAFQQQQAFGFPGQSFPQMGMPSISGFPGGGFAQPQLSGFGMPPSFSGTFAAPQQQFLPQFSFMS